MEKPSDAPRGQFSLTEVSPGVYKIEATDPRGRSFEASGTDRDELTAAQRRFAPITMPWSPCGHHGVDGLITMGGMRMQMEPTLFLSAIMSLQSAAHLRR